MVIAPFMADNAGAAYLSDGSVLNGSTGLLGVVKNYCVAPPASATTGVCPSAVERDDLTAATCAGPGCSVSSLNTQALCVAAGYRWRNTQSGSSNQQPLSARGTITQITAGSCSAAFWTGDIPGTVGTSTAGNKWYTYSNDGCLRCHNATYMASHGASGARAAKTSYLMGGHRNMLRKVTPGMNWAGPDGKVYTTDGTNAINFGTGTVTLASDGQPHKLYWIYGDWLIPSPSLVYDTAAGPASGTTNGYSCAACHSTGFDNWKGAGACSIPTATTTSACTTAGGTWVYSTGIMNGGAAMTSATGLEPLASFPSLSLSNITGNWDQYGIMCSRCHNSTNPALNDAGGNVMTGGHNNNPTGTAKTNLCFGCHQSTTKIYASAADTTGTPQIDPTQIPVGGGHGASYARDFNGHVLGNSFLNSPHAKFTGTMTTNVLGNKDLSPAGKYASYFSASYTGLTGTCNDSTGSEVFPVLLTSAACSAANATNTWTSEAGSCVTCHDVHQSIVAGVVNPDGTAAKPIKRDCTTCHTGAHGPATFNHPGGPGTPLENYATDKASACVICHMSTVAKDAGTLSFPMHVFRINTDPNYNTFPTKAQFFGCSDGKTSQAGCVAAGGTLVQKQVIANTAFDTKGNYANAVWVDIDNACGQCHGGGTAIAPTYTVQNGAPYLTKAALATFAAGMHTVGQLHNSVSNVAGPSTTPVTTNTRPTGTNSVTQSGWRVDVTDTYTAQNAANCSATVTWGDGTSSTQACKTGTFSHTYTQAGTYAVLEIATDTVNYMTASAVPAEMSVPVKHQVTVTVTDTTSTPSTPLNMAAVYLYGQSGKQYAGLTGLSAAGSVTINNVNADIYGLRVVKGCYTCTLSSATVDTTSGNGNASATCSIQ